MTNKNRFSKPVAFNSNREDDQLILNHVKRRNFSGYVKKLILADIQSRNEQKHRDEPKNEVKTEVTNTADRLKQMQEQIKKSGKPALWLNQPKN